MKIGVGAELYESEIFLLDNHRSKSTADTKNVGSQETSLSTTALVETPRAVRRGNADQGQGARQISFNNLEQRLVVCGSTLIRGPWRNLKIDCQGFVDSGFSRCSKKYVEDRAILLHQDSVQDIFVC